MGDSDDELDRRRRDKFRRERSDMERSREREERRRDDWPERDWDRGRERRREYDRGRRERFSPPRHMSPQHKRMRRDWDDHRGEPYRYDMPYGGPPFPGGPHWPPELPHLPPPHGHPLQGRLGLMDPDLPPPGPPTMRSFKDFLLNLEDNVDETEAVKRYNQYKLDFRRQQLQDFFLSHKQHEWFRSKYHPDDITARRAETQAALKTRLDVFLFLLDNHWLDDIKLDMDHASKIIKLMDAAVIKMEGGTDLDLQVLETPVAAGDAEGGTSAAIEGGATTEPGSESKDSEQAGTSNEKPKAADTSPETKDQDKKEENEETKQNGEEEKMEEEKKEEEDKKKRGRKRKHSVSADSGEGSASESDSDQSEKEQSDKDQSEHEEDEEEEPDSERRKKRKERSKKEEGPAKPRPLHLTTSLFIRTIPPEVSKEELTNLCRRYPGFLRVALSDPQPERRFFRRCWVTFDRSVNIKETCWNLQNIRLKDVELAPVVNRDLCRRVRSVNGLTYHKPIIRNDIRLSAKLIHALDQKGALWSSEMESNPVLKNITDYLIEEVSAEEEELTGVAANEANEAKDPSEVSLETDETLLQVLDRLLLYLRLVHSVDYYNFCEYPAEDEMPHRCGLMHVRGPLPVGKITAAEVSEHLKMCDQRMAPLLSLSETVSEEEAARLGKKDPEQEVEKFLTANTQELSKDKWLCPLSGKKFKAPEFVRKHILNKHGEKVSAVRQEVQFFNNFLLDPKRPALPENKPLPPPAPPTAMQPFPGQSPQQQQSILGYPPGVRPPMPGFPGAGPYPAQFGAGRGNYDSFRGNPSFQNKPRGTRGMRGDPRSIIEYRDLDAPDDLDFF
ncbi:serrate RNA effector molecule homolog [Boleophthalmus pectinirostris]|uniref:serrate RNA effector molecule homolog n=1 Tax=Boleophthalmus pectinirostris TaxID=150288 RepID=UPI0024302CFC|nr:serrate RNA effector molecule homolog [Boleophthalmus pectinirostris]